MSVFVIGHKNPDLDSVASAIALAHLKKELEKEDWLPAVAGKVDAETEFVLKKFGFDVPQELKSVAGKNIALVDHCCTSQMADECEKANIVEVVDHHNISDIRTSRPIRYHAEPVGSTCTIVYTYFKNNKIPVSKHMAGLLLAGIISDTDLFKSPTTTKLDKEISEELGSISGVNAKELGIEMFKIKSNYANKTMREILTEDLKEYEMPLAIKLGCSQFKLMEFKPFFDKNDIPLRAEISKIVKEKNYGLFVAIITDLLEEGSQVYAEGKTDIFEKTFKVKLKNGSVWMPGVMSRKKQIIPLLIGEKE